MEFRHWEQARSLPREEGIGATQIRSDQIMSSVTHSPIRAFLLLWVAGVFFVAHAANSIYSSIGEREREYDTDKDRERERERGIWVTSFFLDQRRFMKKQSDLFSQCGFCVSVLLLVDLVFFPSLPFFMSSWCFLGVCMQLTPMQLASLQICDLLLFVLFDWHSVLGFHLCGGRFGAFFTSLLVSSSAA